MSDRSARLSNRAYLSLGSNIEPERNLPAALRALTRHGDLAAVSRVWETRPADGSDQPNYLNAAVLLQTQASAEELCRDVIAQVEHQLHRVRVAGDKFAPRTIDVDLSLFNSAVLQVGARRIPDPDIQTRVFVAVPLAELDPTYIHPETGETLAEIATRLSSRAPTLVLRQDVTDALKRIPLESKGGA